MASLTEELISVLQQEQDIYNDLMPIVEKKTRIIVNNDLQALRDITETEQLTVERIAALERKRDEVIINMGVVLNRDPRTLKLKTLVKLFEKRPEEQKKLSVLYDSLTTTIKRLVQLNERNQMLIQQSLEMIEFNLNLIQSTRMAPGSGNYNKGASTFDMQAAQTGMFDAKQ